MLASGVKTNSMGTQRMVGLKLQKLGEFITQDSLEEGYQYLLSYWDNPDQLFIRGGRIADTIKYYRRPNTTEFIEQAMYWDQMNYLPGDNLAKVDRASMAVSLETRLPLLSHQIAEISWRIPRSMKVRNGNSKWILKQILNKYIPRELVDRPKMGFSVPIAYWLRNELCEWASDLLGSSRVKDNEILDQRLISRVWREHATGEKDHALKLWSVLMYLSWLDR
jgi:asparagine synthase (glutamine-hydrolysing)